MEKYNLVPADTYVVVNKTILHNEDRKIITSLYLPIIGTDAVMLYFTLWADLDNSEILSSEFSHQKLVSSLRITINELQTSFDKLEAIGLIKAFIKEGNVNNYIYEIFSPVSASEFLSHPILNIVLYSNVGKREYDNLVKAFKIPRLNTSNYKDITKSFNDVFESTSMTSYDLSLEDIRKYNKLKLNINSNFDFNFLISSMPKNLDTSKMFSKDIKELIINLSFIYDIDAIKMANIVKVSLNDNGTINRESLRKNSRNFYQFSNGGLLPTIIDNNQPEYLRKPIGDTSRRAKMIYTFETISPRELLINKNNGNEPTRRDLKLIEDLLVDYKLKPGVVNVLLDYAINVNNKKLTRGFVETIAGEWQRKGIETVEDAMNNCEKVHKKSSKRNYKDDNVNMKTPDWFDKEIDKSNVSDGEENQLEELLKEYNIDLERNFDKEMEDDTFKKIVSKIKLSKDEIIKYTSLIKDSSLELKNCANCKNIMECKNSVVGHVYYPEAQEENIVFSYVPCKYKKKLDKDTEYQNNISLFDMPKAILEASMKNIYTDDKNRLDAIKWLTTFIKKYENNENCKGLYLAGNFGCGKTYLISAMFNELAKKGVKSVTVYYPEFLRELKGRFGEDYNEVFNKVRKAPLLLLDDIGAETVTNWNRDEILGSLLQYRMQEGLPTFFTSNNTIKELEEHLIGSDSEGRVKSRRIIERIKYLTDEIIMVAENRRK